MTHVKITTGKRSWRELITALKAEVTQWTEGRLWWWRGLSLAWLVYIAVRHLSDPLYTSLFGGLDLGIHEGGHLLFSWAPKFIMVLAGSFTQCAAPLIAAWLFLRQPDYFAVPVCGAWFADNLYSVAAYVSDARAMELPLVSVGGGQTEHDWNYILGSLGLLRWDTFFGGAIRLLALVIMALSLAAGAWILWTMARSSKQPASSS